MTENQSSFRTVSFAETSLLRQQQWNHCIRIRAFSIIELSHGSRGHSMES